MGRKDITIDELMKHSLVINLAKDKHRLALMQEAFARVELPMPRRIEGISMHGVPISPSPQWTRGNLNSNRYALINCSASHVMCVAVAKAFDWPWVFVFEDDAIPSDNAPSEVITAISKLPHDKSIIRFGCLRAHNGRKWGDHATLIFKEAYDTYLSAFRVNLRRYGDRVYTEFAPLSRITKYEYCGFVQRKIEKGKFMYSQFNGDGQFKEAPPAGVSLQNMKGGKR